MWWSSTWNITICSQYQWDSLRTGLRIFCLTHDLTSPWAIQPPGATHPAAQPKFYFLPSAPACERDTKEADMRADARNSLQRSLCEITGCSWHERACGVASWRKPASVPESAIVARYPACAEKKLLRPCRDDHREEMRGGTLPPASSTASRRRG